MPSAKNRHRVEVDEGLYEQLRALATREGYPVARFTDKLLFMAVNDYVKARRAGRHPFDSYAPPQRIARVRHETDDA